MVLDGGDLFNNQYLMIVLAEESVSKTSGFSNFVRTRNPELGLVIKDGPLEGLE
jgi:hypothetical protein